MTGKALAAAAGAVAGYVVHQRKQDPTSSFGTDPKDDLVARAPLTNIAAAILAAVVTRSAFAGFLVGFAVSALGGDQLNQMVARKVEEQRGTSQEPQFSQAA